MSMAQLSLEIDDPAWDSRAARERIDMFAIVDGVIRGFDEVSSMKKQEAPGGCREEDMFTKCAGLVRMLKANWITQIAAQDGSLGVAVPPEDVLRQNDEDGLGFRIEGTEAWMSQFFEMNWEP